MKRILARLLALLMLGACGEKTGTAPTETPVTPEVSASAIAPDEAADVGVSEDMLLDPAAFGEPSTATADVEAAVDAVGQAATSVAQEAMDRATESLNEHTAELMRRAFQKNASGVLPEAATTQSSAASWAAADAPTTNQLAASAGTN